MNNVFQRQVDIQTLKDVPVADYSPQELVAFLTTAYPYDPLGALDALREKYMIGTILADRTRLLLEGLVDVTNE